MPPKVTDEYKQEKRDAILESAMHCFANKGYLVTTIDDIVRHVKASKGAIYHYFNSKEEIFLELLLSRDARAFEQLREQLATIESAVERIRFLIDRFRKFPADPQTRSWQRVHFEFFLYSANDDKLNRIMQERYESFLAFITEIFEEGKAKEEFRAGMDFRTLASLFWAIRDGIGLHHAVLDNLEAYDKIWKMAEEMLIRYTQSEKVEKINE